MDENGPKWRLEHASTGQAVCQQASCKQNKTLIAKGELRIGTHTLFNNDFETRWYMAWRHWGCATRHQIKGLKETTDNDPTKAPGYDTLSPESQEQVRLAFEQGIPVDKQFKDIREDLAKGARKYGREYRNVEGYKVDIATRKCTCRGGDCSSGKINITKGELRLGIIVPFDGEHSSTVYKHWRCMSTFDLENAKEYFENESFESVENLPEEVRQAVFETFQTDKIVEPPEHALELFKAKTMKPRSKKSKASVKDEGAELTTEEPEGEVEEALSSPAPKAKAKKSNAKKRTRKETDMSSDSEPEYVPKKSRSRAIPFQEAEAEAEAPAEGATATTEEQTPEEA